jgi:uncharacterized protein YdeI (YjbR/CyaY-like superfamily)
MAKKTGKTTVEFYAKDRQAWREWLEKNHETEKSVWLTLYHRDSRTPCVNYEDAVEEAICFGWIDSRPEKRDAESSLLLFARRNPVSKWSQNNRERAERMIRAGLMNEVGLRMVELAKKSGTWTALENVQKNVIPDDLQEVLDASPRAKEYFMAFPPSSKRIILEWIQNAKKPETRQKRIEETVRLAAKNIKANHYRQ